PEVTGQWQKRDNSPQYEKGRAIAQSDYCRILFAS
ncbi:hypothetical protein EC970010_1172, partial [Escherichia coli 97.0010]